MAEHFLNGKVTLHCGDCREVLAQLVECSIDSCVTDPPYHLTSIVKRFGSENAAPAQYGTDGAYKRASAGFMGQQWDGGDVAFRPETWAEVYRVLKPGGYLLAFSGTRTYHRMACAIEDAGFEVRDMVSWLYGSGFPKSHDVSKGIDKAAGARGTEHYTGANYKNEVYGNGMGGGHTVAPYDPATPAARQWAGWGTALKPALEPICMARKPLSEGTVAANVLEWGTGAINVDGCRVGTDAVKTVMSGRNGGTWQGNCGLTGTGTTEHTGRWPANVILSVPEDEYELKVFTSSEQKRELFRWLSENA